MEQVRESLPKNNTVCETNEYTFRSISDTYCLLKHVTAGRIEGAIEVTERRGERSKQLLVEFKEDTRNFKNKHHRNLWRTRFGRSYVLPLRQAAELNN